MTHRYTKAQPEGRANQHAAKDGTATDGVPQYLPGAPTGSAADVRAKGAWAVGWWTFELARKLDTGHTDDTPFDPKRAYKMAVSPHDRPGDMGRASGALELTFAKK
jgi:hypothetical protein